jgi:iron complex outermembrane recepter protein
MSQTLDRAWVACALCAVLLMSAVGHAQRSARLSGSVQDASGARLAGVTIALRGATASTSTNEEGQFEFRSLPEGEYELIADLAGFAPTRQTIRVMSEQPATVSLTLTLLLLEHTVVTASKTGETDVQTTPIAVSVLRGEDLSRMEDHTVEHIAGRAPGVTFSQNTGFAQLTIRGIGTNAVLTGSDPSSAVYLDGVYLARPAMALADFLEVDRVEVLRGPQGTLYGRNSLGGAINLISKAPTNDVEASVRLAGGTDDVFRTEARVSGPLVREKVMGSVSFLRGVRGGDVRDLEHPDHPLGGEDVIAARGQLRVVLNPRSELHLSGDVNHRDPTPLFYNKILAVKPGFQVDNPADLHEVRTSFPAEGDTFQSGASARFTFNVTPSIQVTSLSAFRNEDFDVLFDEDISELDIDRTRVHEIQHQVSEELTIASRNQRVTWIGGLFLFDEVSRMPSSVRLPQMGIDYRFDPRVDADASALFGQASARLTSRVTATAGLRYTHERKTIDNSGGLYILDTQAGLVPGTAYAYTDAISNDAWTPKFGVEMRVRENVLAYGSAARGFKSGGFSPTSTEAGLGFAPEFAWSYEGGVKADLRGGRARLNVAAFYTDYTDLQVQTTIRPQVIAFSNAAEATIQGVEVEAQTLVGDAVQLGGHVALLDTRYDRYIAIGVGGATGDVAGNKLNNSPEWSGRTWIDWTRSIGRASSLSLRADVAWKTTVFFTPFNDAIQRQGPLGLLDVSAQFAQKHQRWSIGAYARNLTNEDYITGTNPGPPPAIGGRPGVPRQVGVQLAIER